MKIHIQTMKDGQYRLVLVGANGKNVLNGEPMHNLLDAEAEQARIVGSPIMVGRSLPPHHKFTKNSGPKKKSKAKPKAKKKK